MLQTVSVTIAAVALVVSVIVFADNRLRSVDAARLARVPVLVFAWDAPRHDWTLTNIGNGPALDVVILQRIGGQWVRPLRMPEMAVQDSTIVPARWVELNSNPGLGARYRSITGERYMTQTGDDSSKHSRGWGDMPATLWKELEPHWRYRAPVSVLDLPENDALWPAKGLDQQPSARSGQGDIVISYRRDDAAGIAGRLYDALGMRFDREQVSMDFDSGPGGDVSEQIMREISGAEVVLVLIGPGWLGAKTSDGNRRLDNPHDHVRIAIEHALRLRVRVIPVLVNGAKMPTAEELPPSLAPLAWRHPAELTDDRWRFDVEQLAAALSRLRAESGKST